MSGSVPVRLTTGEITELFRRAEAARGPFRLTVDLVHLQVTDGAGFSASFTLDAYRRESLLQGLDEIGRTLLLGGEIAEFERRRDAFRSRIEA